MPSGRKGDPDFYQLQVNLQQVINLRQVVLYRLGAVGSGPRTMSNRFLSMSILLSSWLRRKLAGGHGDAWICWREDLLTLAGALQRVVVRLACLESTGIYDSYGVVQHKLAAPRERLGQR